MRLTLALLVIGVVSASVALRIPRAPHPHDDGPSASGKHPEPMLVLNETDILLTHAPDPLSYWAHDFERGDPNPNWRGLMAIHVGGMTLAFFALLPVGIALRSVKHSCHGLVVVAFNVLVLLSSAAASLYKKLTGDLYQGSAHGRGSYFVIALAAVLSAFDALDLLRRALTFFRGTDRTSVPLFWRSVVLNQERPSATTAEYISLVHAHSDEYIQAKLVSPDDEQPEQARAAQSPGAMDASHAEWVNQDPWPDSPRAHRDSPVRDSRHSITSSCSEDTLHSPTAAARFESQRAREPPRSRPWPARLGRALFATLERALVVLAFVQTVSGATVYTGLCRGNYLNGCLAHLIKGGIFWCYGLLTFGRYVGAWADIGWAWNRLPPHRARRAPSAETVESFVILFYGATNVWMERFGAPPGSAFTTKQIQHISIAAMFWFAGLLGLALESHLFRRWLAASATATPVAASAAAAPVAAPPSYAASFNPFPALVIGVTGAAMSAHHQTYLFSVQIHALWGFFLTAFAVLRCLTYFLLWLRPPHSLLPSRPPTEAVASFALTSGGLVFIMSTEQIVFAAMRRQHDDVMFFFNFAVAVTCLAFCWILAITAFKGWVTSRASRAPSFTRHVLFSNHVA